MLNLMFIPSIHSKCQTVQSDINVEHHHSRSQLKDMKFQKVSCRCFVYISVSSLWEIITEVNRCMTFNNELQESVVYLLAIYLVIYSNVTGSSTVNLWLWHSICARLINTLASAVRPAKAITTWSSRRHILRTVRSSCSLATDFFSTPSTTTSDPRTPTFQEQHQFITLGVIR